MYASAVAQLARLTEEDGLIRIRAGGTLDGSDYDRFVLQLERIAEMKFFEPSERQSAERWVRVTDSAA